MTKKQYEKSKGPYFSKKGDSDDYSYLSYQAKTFLLLVALYLIYEALVYFGIL